MALPAHANVVIVGGGIAGCSIAYHLTRIGITDVVLLERKQLTCGTTWHAAGLVGQLRATSNLTELAKYTADLYHSLEAETGQATGFKQNGSISVAKTPARLEELKRGASMGKTFGLRGRRTHDRRDQGTLAAARSRRRRRRHLPAQGRPDQPDRHDAGAGQGRQAARRKDLREHQGRTCARRERTRRRCRNRVRLHCGRHRGALRGHVVAAHGRRHRRGRAAARRRAFLHRHRAHAGAAAATCRCCACRTNAPTTRKTPASC